MAKSQQMVAMDMCSIGVYALLLYDFFNEDGGSIFKSLVNVARKSLLLQTIIFLQTWQIHVHIRFKETRVVIIQLLHQLLVIMILKLKKMRKGYNLSQLLDATSNILV